MRYRHIFLIGFALLMTGCSGAVSDKASQSTAQWVIGKGGSVNVVGRTLDFKAVTDLPSGSFAIDRLILNNTQVTDNELQKNLVGLEHITYLGLHTTSASDAAIDSIVGLKTLTELELSHTQITDDGLSKLKGLSGLKKLYIYNNVLTDKAIADVKSALPNCTIHH